MTPAARRPVTSNSDQAVDLHIPGRRARGVGGGGTALWTSGTLLYLSGVRPAHRSLGGGRDALPDELVPIPQPDPEAEWRSPSGIGIHPAGSPTSWSAVGSCACMEHARLEDDVAVIGVLPR